MNAFNIIQFFLLILGAGRITMSPQDVSSTTVQDTGTTSHLPQASQSTPSVTGTTGSYYATSSASSPTPSTPITTPSSSLEKNEKLSNCSTASTLEGYCDNLVAPDDLKYFANNTSVRGILSTIINASIVEELQHSCSPGNWCLSDTYHTIVLAGKNTFYNSPLCRSKTFWKCLEKIEFYRRGCNESTLYFLMSTVGMLCDMEVIDGGYISHECYTRTMEAVTVFYSDVSRTPRVNVSSNVGCGEYIKSMSMTYGCAAMSCNIDQNVFLKDFGPWMSMATNSLYVVEHCNVTMKCPNMGHTGVVAGGKNASTTSDLTNALNNQKADKAKLNEKIQEVESAIAVEEAIDEIMGEMMGSTGTTGYWTTDPTATATVGLHGKNMDIPESSMDDQTFIYGMVTVTVVVLVGLTLIGVLTFKKINLRRKNYKLGYSQMSEEETRMLKSDYN